MFDWICALTADCLTCHNNNPNPEHKQEVPIEENQNQTFPLCRIHIGHKGHFHPPSNRNIHCLLVIDAFFRLLMIYPVNSTSGQATITTIEKWIHFLEFLSLSYTTEALFPSIQNLIIGLRNWESPYDREQHTRLEIMAKLKRRINTFTDTGKFF